MRNPAGRPRPIVIVVLAVLAACGDGTPQRTAGADTTAVDDLGRTVTFETPPARVLSLAPSITELVYAVGGSVVAVSPVDDYPPEVAGLPRFSTFPLDHERVVALQPDLILATDQVNRPDDADALAEAGVPSYFLHLDGPADVPGALRTVGTLIGRDGEPAAAEFERRLAAIRDSLAGSAPPRVLMLVGDETPYTFSIASAMVEAAGGLSVTADIERSGVVLSEEWVLNAAPDVVVVLISDYDPAELVRHHPAWAQLPAALAGRVHGLDPDLASRPGPRMADGVELLARLLHPDRFARSP